MTLLYFLFYICDSNISENELNNDMQKISEWAYKCKMSLNPDLNKQALKNFIAPFYGWVSTASWLEPLQEGSLLFTTKFQKFPILILPTSEG